MGLADENRTCPICEQIVPSGMEDSLSIKISPARRIHVHSGCAAKIAEKYNEWVGNVQDSASRS